jgi:ubiquinone/menaquinone biosynthesis C-methylase UbiE
MGYTQAHKTQEYLRLVAEMVAKHKRRTYELMQLQSGHTVLDVGCGPGTDTIELGRLVGSAGQVIGVDHAQNQVDVADEKTQEAGVAAWVMHRVADATALPFEPNTFDSSRSERVFQHLRQPQLALAEMIRVTKPQGWIVVLDTDWSTLSTDTPEIDIEQRINRFHVERGFASGFVGRQLYRMARQQGLMNIHIEMAPTFVTNCAIGRRGAMLDETEQAALEAGVITQEELERWRRSLEEADERSEYFASINQVMLAGQKA